MVWVLHALDDDFSETKGPESDRKLLDASDCTEKCEEKVDCNAQHEEPSEHPHCSNLLLNPHHKRDVRQHTKEELKKLHMDKETSKKSPDLELESNQARNAHGPIEHLRKQGASKIDSERREQNKPAKQAHPFPEPFHARATVLGLTGVATHAAHRSHSHHLAIV